MVAVSKPCKPHNNHNHNRNSQSHLGTRRMPLNTCRPVWRGESVKVQLGRYSEGVSVSSDLEKSGLDSTPPMSAEYGTREAMTGRTEEQQFTRNRIGKVWQSFKQHVHKKESWSLFISTHYCWA